MVRIETPGSTAVRSVEWHAQDSVLVVEFVSGGVYSYFGVPSRVWEELRLAHETDSVGKFVKRWVVGQYSYSTKKYKTSPVVPLPNNVYSLTKIRRELSDAGWFADNVRANASRQSELAKERAYAIKQILARDKSTRYPDGWR